MAAAPRGVPRFLPTLTEVVLPSAVTRLTAQPQPSGLSNAMETAIAAKVRAQVDSELEGLFRDAVSGALLEQVDVIAARVRSEIEPTLRQAVADMVAHEIASRRHT